jgi:hypothetical protein
LALADRDLINTNYPRAGRACTLELRLHVLLLERIDRVPVQLNSAATSLIVAERQRRPT